MILFILNVFKTTFNNIKCNKQAFIMSITTISIAFSILGFFFLIFVNLNTLLSTWDKHVQLIVYLDDGILKKNLSALEKIFNSNKEIILVSFVSREDAWKHFKNAFSEKSGFIEGLNFNPLPASYILKFKNNSVRLKNIRKLSESLRLLQGVESLEYGEKWISRFEKFMFFLRVVILVVGGILCIGLILIISNTIRISIFSRQDEINLMLLLGATYRFIKAPLLLEGLIQGMVGVFVAMSVVKLTHIYISYQFQGSLESIFRGVESQFLTNPLILGMVITSGFVGLVGSLISINQFLMASDRK